MGSGAPIQPAWGGTPFSNVLVVGHREAADEPAATSEIAAQE